MGYSWLNHVISSGSDNTSQTGQIIRSRRTALFCMTLEKFYLGCIYIANNCVQNGMKKVLMPVGELLIHIYVVQPVLSEVFLLVTIQSLKHGNLLCETFCCGSLMFHVSF